MKIVIRRLTKACPILALIFLTACAGTIPLREVKPAADLQWPEKPEKARIQWVKTIRNYQDAGIAKGFWKRALEFLTGPDQRRIVRPHDVLVDDKERLFIADPGAGVVHLMDVRERRYAVIGGESGSPLRTPIGLAEDDRDRLFITDPTTATVYLYDLSLGSLKPFLAGTLKRPTGIAYNRVNKLLYIVDTIAHQVVAVDEQGGIKVRIGAAGEGKGQFNHPTDIAVDAKGRVYVTDPLNYKIKIFTPEGRPVNQFGAAGDAPGYLNKPKGIAVDGEGHIYVSDALIDAIQIYDDGGRLLLLFGANGTGNGEFWMPSGIFIDRHNYIFVSDTYNQRVQVFRYLPDAGPEGAPAGAGRTQ